MGVLAVIHVQAQPGRGADLAIALERPMGVTKDNPDCPSIELFTSAEDPDHLVLIEEWSSEAAHQQHVEKLIANGDLAAADAMYASPPHSVHYPQPD